MSSPHALDTAGLDLTLADTQAIDDCWNRIGIHGDKSCPLLADHIHCRNCAVYSAAATRLLDRYALQQDDHRPHAAVEVGEDVVTRSLLMFRLGEEWLGIATRCLVEVAPLQPIHSLPHQRSRALLGVANVRGALVAAPLLTMRATKNGHLRVPVFVLCSLPWWLSCWRSRPATPAGTCSRRSAWRHRP